MGKRIILRKVIITSSIIILCTIASLIYSIVEINKPDNLITTNKVRILLNDPIYKAENGDFSKLNKYTYSIYDLKGTVIESNDISNPKGSKKDIKTFSSICTSTDSKYVTYTSPYIKNDKQSGTIIVKVNTSHIDSSSYAVYIPLIILSAIIILLIISLIKIIKNDILHPIDELHECANSISKGNFEKQVYYDYDGEVGTLCHDFEALRLNLSYSINNEKELKEKEKLLLAYISHDLRTPIAAISGYVEGINSGIVNDKESIKEYTNIVLKKTKILNKLIDDILTQSKAQLNEFSINKSECYSYDFFNDVISEIKKDVESNNIKFTHNEIPNVLINIDKIRIKQVMQNLISNAIKFTKKDGAIEIIFTLADNNILISVKDNGMGIAAQDLPMIFHEFFRGEKARTQNVPGSGLGLSISKYIVEKHGGLIECDSILNYGSTFTFSIPY